jgi:hypothetical protein
MRHPRKTTVYENAEFGAMGLRTLARKAGTAIIIIYLMAKELGVFDYLVNSSTNYCPLARS